jgi:hypothetical protein
MVCPILFEQSSTLQQCVANLSVMYGQRPQHLRDPLARLRLIPQVDTGLEVTFVHKEMAVTAQRNSKVGIVVAS